jgi:hypothetical protein
MTLAWFVRDMPAPMATPCGVKTMVPNLRLRREAPNHYWARLVCAGTRVA